MRGARRREGGSGGAGGSGPLPPGFLRGCLPARVANPAPLLAPSPRRRAARRVWSPEAKFCDTPTLVTIAVSALQNFVSGGCCCCRPSWTRHGRPGGAASRGGSTAQPGTRTHSGSE